MRFEMVKDEMGWKTCSLALRLALLDMRWKLLEKKQMGDEKQLLTKASRKGWLSILAQKIMDAQK